MGACLTQAARTVLRMVSRLIHHQAFPEPRPASRRAVLVSRMLRAHNQGLAMDRGATADMGKARTNRDIECWSALL
jgi:hypothetical protein